MLVTVTRQLCSSTSRNGLQLTGSTFSSSSAARSTIRSFGNSLPYPASGAPSAPSGAPSGSGWSSMVSCKTSTSLRPSSGPDWIHKSSSPLCPTPTTITSSRASSAPTRTNTPIQPAPTESKGLGQSVLFQQAWFALSITVSTILFSCL